MRFASTVTFVRALVLAASIACGSSPAPARVEPPVIATKPTIPDTAAGHTLTAWLDAFNSGDSAHMKAFVERYKDPEGLVIINSRERTGGFDLMAIEKSEPRSITFVVREKATATPT